MTIFRITVDGAAYDEPDEFVVPDAPAVRAALRSWQSACDFHGDGSVSVEVSEDCIPAVMTTDQFREAAANAIGADADEIDALPRLWRAGQEWRR